LCFRYVAADIAPSIRSDYSLVLCKSVADSSFADGEFDILIRAFTAYSPVRGGRRTLFAIAGSLALSSLCGTATGNAADGNEGQKTKEILAVSEDSPEVVYVTARRRTERAQDVPSR
jgi:hypothetical protein